MTDWKALIRDGKAEEIDFGPEEFKDMHFNVYALPPDKNVATLPQVSKHKIFKKNTLGASNATAYNNRALRYLFYVYDVNSPYARFFENIIQRKAIVADFVFGLNKDNEFNKSVLAIMENKNKVFNSMVIYFCISISNKSSYYQYVVYQEKFYRMLEQLRVGSDDVSIKNLQFYEDQLKKLSKSIFADDDNYSLADEFYSYLKSQDLKLRPEDIADVLDRLEDPFKGEEFDNESE